MTKQLTTTGAAIWDALPLEWNESSPSIELDGFSLAPDQAAAIATRFERGIPLTLQALKGRADVVVRSDLMPTGVWYRVAANGVLTLEPKEVS